jgi:hypothetical protein
MEKISRFVMALIVLVSIFAVQVPAYAASSSTPDILITAFGGSELLDFAEIYNQSADPINTSGSQLDFSIHDAQVTGCYDQVYSIDLPSGWLLPQHYLTVERGIDYAVSDSFLAGCKSPQLVGLSLKDSSGHNLQNITFLAGTLNATNWATHNQRGDQNLKIFNDFNTDYSVKDTVDENLYSGTLYQPPDNTSGLQIVELLPHAANCSPTDDNLLCHDYVKLFNDSDHSINLADYRLRSSYGGQSSSSRNTISLTGELQPGEYQLINSRDDGSSLSLTQSGGYVWLEDAFGVQAYDPVIQYPDASADSKIGQSWAFDGENWQWSNSPEPLGPNDFPLGIVNVSNVSISTSSSLKPCAADQERNPATNRCRKISSYIKSLTPCKSGQVRNPATNRCRSIKASEKSLTPCKPGQIRNPATNRCRSASAATKAKKPCKPEQERNPETGRCRKAQPKLTPIHDIKTAAKSSDSRWYIMAAIVAAIGIYVVWEWRQEVMELWDRAGLMSRQKGQNLLK